MLPPKPLGDLVLVVRWCQKDSLPCLLASLLDSMPRWADLEAIVAGGTPTNPHNSFLQPAPTAGCGAHGATWSPRLGHKTGRRSKTQDTGLEHRTRHRTFSQLQLWTWSQHDITGLPSVHLASENSHKGSLCSAVIKRSTGKTTEAP